jgi:hypothetical protein
MKLTSLQQNTKQLRLRPSKRNVLDGAISPKDTSDAIIAPTAQSDTITERKSSARIITNMISPKAPSPSNSNPLIKIDAPEQVELVVIEKEDDSEDVCWQARICVLISA